MEGTTDYDHVEPSPPSTQKPLPKVSCDAGEILNQPINACRYFFCGVRHLRRCYKICQVKRKRTQYKLENFLGREDKYDLLLMIDVFEHIDDYMRFVPKPYGYKL
jgi:hypothetical protein